MTQVSMQQAHSPSRFNEYVAGALTVVVLTLSAVLLLAQFAA